MIWSFDAVMKKLGDEAQVTAGGIIIVIDVEGPDGYPRKKHLKVGFFNGMEFHLTPEGREYIEPTITDAEIVSEVKKPRAKKKAEEVVEDDLGLLE
jgi:hypothetical protein